MKVSYYSYGADSGGEYEVVEKDIPRSLLGQLLPIPATQNDGEITLEEAAQMAIGDHFDDGSFEIIEPPSSEKCVLSSGYIVTFHTNGGCEVIQDPVYVAEMKDKAKKEVTLQDAAPCILKIGVKRYLVRLFPPVDEVYGIQTSSVRTDGNIVSSVFPEGKSFEDRVYENFSYIIESDYTGNITGAALSTHDFPIGQFVELIREKNLEK